MAAPRRESPHPNDRASIDRQTTIPASGGRTSRSAREPYREQALSGATAPTAQNRASAEAAGDQELRQRENTGERRAADRDDGAHGRKSLGPESSRESSGQARRKDRTAAAAPSPS